MTKHGMALLATALATGAAALLSGCSPRHYRESADKEVYGIIRATSPVVPGMVSDFTIEQPERDLLAGCPRLEPAPSAEGEAEEPGAGGEAPIVLSLGKALEVAALNSREYQSEKESVYLSALGLTLRRYAFSPQFFGSVEGEYEVTDLGEERQVSAGSNFGFTKLFRTGAALTASLATDVSRFLTGDPRKSASSFISIAVTQPLLRGAGIAVTEPLTQAERNVIYEVRDFVRFRRRFFVNILSDYYAVLRDAQIVANEESNFESLQFQLERDEAMQEAGRLPGFQVDQTNQRVLAAEDSLKRARQRYENRLDEFKITLGLPTEARIVLDPAELERLLGAEVTELTFEAEDATRTALQNRLDLLTAQDEVDDAERKVQVAVNDLKPGLDLSAALDSDTEGNSPTNFQGDRTDWSVGFELDLPLDKLSERNAYRSRLIELERQRRGFCESQDRVIQDVREAYRQVQRGSSSYAIQQKSVELAVRRVENTEMLLEMDRAIVRDVLEAKDDLLRAQNDLATAVVEFRVARLALARDMEVLAVSDTGQLEESFDEYL